MQRKMSGNTVIAHNQSGEVEMVGGSGIPDQDPLPGPLSDALPVGLLVLDHAGHVLVANRMAETFLGVRASEMHGRMAIRAAFDVVCRPCSSVPFRDVELAQLARLGQDEKPGEMVLERLDGSQVWLNLRATSLPQSRVAITLEDIGSRIRHAAALEAHTRLVEQADDLGLEKLLCASLDELQALTGSAVGAYSFLDEDERCIRPQAWSTQVEAHGYGGKGSPLLLTLQGAWAEAVKQRRAVVHNEPSTSANAWPFPHGSVPVGRELVVPVVRKGKVRAVVGLANKPSCYDEADNRMVERLASLSWELASLKLAKADAERRAEQIQKVAASTPGLVGMLRMDRDGRATLHHVSPVDDDFYGVPASGLATDLSGFVTRIHPDDIERLRQALAVSSEGLAPYHQRWRFQHSSKGWRWHESWAVPQREPDGSTLWYGFLMDVTAQADVEAVAAENMARFEGAFEHAPIGIVLTRLDFKLAKVNQAFCDMLGFSKDELLDVEILSLTHPDDRRLTLEGRQLATHAEDGKATHRLEKRYRHKHGHWIWVQVDFSLVRDRSGNPSHFVSQVHDISQRKRAEQERSLTIEILGILNRTDDPITAARLILTALRTALEVDAAAIRLVENGDLGYAVHEGFSQEFLEAERCLHPGTDCACRRVARGQTDTTSAVFTPNGSACIDNSPAMLPEPSKRAQRHSARNPCFRFGYQSVLVVPVRSGDRILGILQLNDRRPQAFSPEQISFLEGIAPTLGLALERKQAAAEREVMAQALQSSEERFAKAFQSAPMLGVISRMVDASIIDVNQEFCRATGYPREQLLGTTPFALGAIQPQKRQEALQALQRDSHLRNHEVALRCKDGSQIDCLLSAEVIDIQGEKLLLSMLADVTESKRAQAAELENTASRAKLAAALDSMTDAVFISDTQGHFIDFNDAFAAFHRFSNKQECLRSFAEFRSIRELFFPSGAPVPVEQWPVQCALRGESGTNVEYQIRRKDTGETWVGSYSYAPIRNSTDTIAGAVIVARDITEQKRAEKALHDLSERLHQISEAANEWIWEVDAQGLYTYSSSVVEHLLGYKPEELVGRYHYYDLWPDQDRVARLPAAMQRVSRKEAFSNLPNTCRHKDGYPVRFETTGFPVFDGSGTLAGYRGANRDVTEREEAEAALRESEVRFRELFEHSPVAVWEEDLSAIAVRFSELRAQGVADLRDYLSKHPEELVDFVKRVRILKVNNASLKLLGATSPEELSRNFLTYLNEGALAAFAEKMAELFAGKAKVETETPHLDAHGNVLHLQLRLSVLPGHASDLSRVLVSFTDLTARKAAEAERHELEREVNHLQRLESLGRLASGVSHDMNNVLGAVMAIGSLLKARHKNDPVLSKDADALLDAAVRGRDLVKGLRDFSRKQLESARKLDLNELVQHEAGLLERTTLKRVSIGCDLAPNLPPVFGEASSIQNALMNLCVNALDAMPDHGTLTLSSRNLGQGFVEVAVQDNGHGMSPEVLARALEPFFTTKPIGKGTGLGLSQVYGTVKAHGGTLDIQSKPGVGTRVSMAFPSVQVFANLKDRTDLWSLGAGRPLSVLLVDDEELVRGTVLSLLDVLGHHAQAASSGIEALRRLDAGMEVDVVMLDINMPGMDGVETLSRLRGMRPELKVLFATGHADERIPSILDRFPAVHILKKPFDIAELAHALSDWP